MTRFAVSTTKRTLSVSVPSRSHRTARRVTPGTSSVAPRVLPRLALLAASPAARLRASASPPGRCDDGRLDRQRRLLGELAIARLLSPTEERFELVVERVGIL